MTDAAKSNWGRWGEQDERGALNAVTPESVLAALSVAGRGRVLSLAQPLDDRTPVPHGKVPPAHYMTRDGGDYAVDGRLLGRSRLSEDVLMMGTHAGTHIDSLAHVWYGEQLFNGHDQSTLKSRGASRCGSDKLAPIIARGVLLDVAAHLGVPALGVDVAVTEPMLRECASRQAVQVRAGDVVLVRTGWLDDAREDPQRYIAGEPGLDVSAAAWLASLDVIAVGADNYAIEVLPEGSPGGFPVHELLIRDCGIPLIEGLVLHELAAAGSAEFTFVALPLPIRGGTASPLNPVAIY